MTWFKVDDGFWRHPKVMDLPDSSVALWTRAGSWAADQLTDGEVPRSALRLLSGGSRAAGGLVSAGLWRPGNDGWQFHDWQDFQPTREQVETKRRVAAERVKRWREKRRDDDEPPPDDPGNDPGNAGT